MDFRIVYEVHKSYFSKDTITMRVSKLADRQFHCEQHVSIEMLENESLMEHIFNDIKHQFLTGLKEYNNERKTSEKTKESNIRCPKGDSNVSLSGFTEGRPVKD